jgi:hypothetical protein
MNLVRRCGSRFSFSVIDFVSPVAKVRAQDHHRRERTRVALPARQCTLTQPLSLEPSLKATQHGIVEFCTADLLLQQIATQRRTHQPHRLELSTLFMPMISLAQGRPVCFR